MARFAVHTHTFTKENDWLSHRNQWNEFIFAESKFDLIGKLFGNYSDSQILKFVESDRLDLILVGSIDGRPEIEVHTSIFCL
jgi:hypothetical protein